MRLIACVNGQAFERFCASDEVCTNGVCIFVPVPDGGGTCTPGCAGPTTARLCNNGIPVAIGCTGGRVCAGGQCVSPSQDGGAGGDGGVCVPACLTETSARVCTSRGQALVVECAQDSPCTGDACTPPASDAVLPGCACTGVSGTLLPAALALLLLRRRRA